MTHISALRYKPSIPFPLFLPALIASFLLLLTLLLFFPFPAPIPFPLSLVSQQVSALASQRMTPSREGERIWDIDDGREEVPDEDYFNFCPGADPNAPDPLNPCPMVETIHYTIPAQRPLLLSPGFPAGLAGASRKSWNREGFPQTIIITFSLPACYSKTGLYLGLNGEGTMNMRLQRQDSLFPSKDIPLQPWWRNQVIPLPDLPAGEYTLTLKAMDNDTYVYFDYLTLTGRIDTDQDGIPDEEEGALDTDADGSPNSDDPDCAFLPIPPLNKKSLLLMVNSEGQANSLSSPVLRHTTLSYNPSDHAAHLSLSLDPNLSQSQWESAPVIVYGILSTTISGIQEGGRVTLILTPPDPVSILDKIFIMSPQKGQWLPTEFSRDTVNNRLSFSLRDGQWGDYDQKADGSVTVIFGISAPYKMEADSLHSCFIHLLTGRRQ